MWDALTPPEDIRYDVLLALVFVCVVAVLMSVAWILLRRANPVRDRLNRTVGQVTAAPGTPPQSPAAEAGPASRIGRLLGAVSAVAKPTDKDDLVGLNSRLVIAGFRGKHALTVYLVSQVLLCLVLGGGVLAYGMLRAETWDNAILYAVPAMAAGFYLPPLFVRHRIRSRQRLIDHALPDALDLTITCVEAGIGMDAALDRVSQEMGLSAPLLSEELVHTSREMRAGISRGEAFRRLARRTGVEELRTLAAIIVQTELFGTSISQTLRTQAEAMRIHRTQSAEERAGKVGVKLTIPLVLCILPALFTVLLGPAAVSFVRVLLPALAGK